MSALDEAVQGVLDEIGDHRLRTAVEDALVLMRAPHNLQAWAANKRAAEAYGYTAPDVAHWTGRIASLVRQAREASRERAQRQEEARYG